MDTKLHKNILGGIRLVLFLVVLVLGGVGFAAWRLLSDDKQPQAKTEETKIPCISEDKTICKFITSWQPSTSYRFTVEDTTDGITTTSTYEYDLNDPDKIHTKVEGGQSYEVISIGNTVYTKAGDTWWKETIERPEQDSNSSGSGEQSGEDFAPVKPTQYTRIGKEACGKLQCYKYEVNDPENTDTQQFIWFDDKEYKLRKLYFESPGSVSEQTFEYIDVKIAAPSNAQELDPGQQITPGDTEPVTL